MPPTRIRETKTQETFNMHRKLVHPNLSHLRKQQQEVVRKVEPEGREEPATAKPRAHSRRRHGPPAVTNAEEFYYLKQMNNETPLVIVLENDVRIRGRIEWYDRGCVKVVQDEGPNLLLFKHSICYLYKQEEE